MKFGQTRYGPVVLAIQPTATELDRWVPGQSDGSWLALENTDAAQTYSAWLEARMAVGSGPYSRIASADWLEVVAGELRIRFAEVAGLAEVRVMATASGAGGNCNYTRREVAA